MAKEISAEKRKQNLWGTLHGTGGLTPKDVEMFPLEYSPIVGEIDVRQHFGKRFGRYNFNEEHLKNVYVIIARHLESEEGMHVATVVRDIVNEFWDTDREALRTKKMKGSLISRKDVKGYMYHDLQDAVTLLCNRNLAKKISGKDGKPRVFPVKE